MEESEGALLFLLPAQRKDGKMIDETKMTRLKQAEEIAHFRAGLCLYSPESYTLEEKQQICNDMAASSKNITDTIRSDFEKRPPSERAKLLNALCSPDPQFANWWWEVLVGEGDPQYRNFDLLA